jgi:hypothetical protein
MNASLLIPLLSPPVFDSRRNIKYLTPALSSPPPPPPPIPPPPGQLAGVTLCSSCLLYLQNVDVLFLSLLTSGVIPIHSSYSSFPVHLSLLRALSSSRPPHMSLSSFPFFLALIQFPVTTSVPIPLSLPRPLSRFQPFLLTLSLNLFLWSSSCHQPVLMSLPP